MPDKPPFGLRPLPRPPWPGKVSKTQRTYGALVSTVSPCAIAMAQVREEHGIAMVSFLGLHHLDGLQASLARNLQDRADRAEARTKAAASAGYTGKAGAAHAGVADDEPRLGECGDGAEQADDVADTAGANRTLATAGANRKTGDGEPDDKVGAGEMTSSSADTAGAAAPAAAAGANRTSATAGAAGISATPRASGPAATAGTPRKAAAPQATCPSAAAGAFGGAGRAPWAAGAALPAPRLLLRLSRDWRLAGRENQRPPSGDWRLWLLLGGRGSGKTRAGAEWVRSLVAAAGSRTDLRIALVAETLADAREVMIEGVSGLVAISGAGQRPSFETSRKRLVWPNGAIAQIFSSEDPESLRGPQFHHAWCDELAKWKHPRETFDMLQFGLRLGQAPRQVVTTTPRPIPLLKAILEDPETRVSRLATAENGAHLAPGFVRALEARYGGTRLGRQELEGVLIEDREDGLWTRGQLERLVQRTGAPLSRIVIGVDPPASAGPRSCCGIVAAGLVAGGPEAGRRAVVLADGSVEGATPGQWAEAVVRLYRRFEADRVVVEVNQGGDMVAALLRSVAAVLPVTEVRASRGKFTRAEPVAALYEQGRVCHAGQFPELVDQMCDFGPDGLSAGRSPDRVDALVWALTALLLAPGAEPRVRGI